MNRVELRGGVTNDSEPKWLPSGDPVVEFTLAVNGTRWSSEQQAQVVKTTFIRVKAYSEVATRLVDAGVEKGDDLYVLGELIQEEWEKKDGTKERKTGVVAFQVTLIRRRSARRTAPAGTEVQGGDPWS